MNDRNRSEFVANQEWATKNRQPERSTWTNPSRCRRPPLKHAPSLFDRFLKLVGLL